MNIYYVRKNQKYLYKFDHPFAIAVNKRPASRLRLGSVTDVIVCWLAWLLVTYHVVASYCKYLTVRSDKDAFTQPF